MTRKTRSVRSEAPALYAVQPTTRPAAIDEDATIALAKQYLWARLKQPGTALTSPQALRDYVNLTLADRPHEVFCIAYLDNRHRVLAFDELFRGTIDGASVYPREVMKATLAHNAAAIVLVHNHPSGVPEPSRADEHITSRLKDTLALIDVRVLDHLIVAGRETVSFAERGLL